MRIVVEPSLYGRPNVDHAPQAIDLTGVRRRTVERR